MAEEKIDIKKLGLYLVEGAVEIDPLTDRVYVRSIDSDGNPVDFDPVPVLTQLKGQEVRVVIVPLASVAYLEEVAKKAQDQGESVVVADAPITSNESN